MGVKTEVEKNAWGQAYASTHGYDGGIRAKEFKGHEHIRVIRLYRAAADIAITVSELHPQLVLLNTRLDRLRGVLALAVHVTISGRVGGRRHLAIGEVDMGGFWLYIRPSLWFPL